jgi:anti-anti-sigma factor
VHAQGELDAYAAPELAETFAEASAEQQLTVVLDLVRVSFMDSTVLGLVTRTVRQLRERGQGVQVVLPETTARRIFEITTLDRALPVAASVADAISASA